MIPQALIIVLLKLASPELADSAVSLNTPPGEGPQVASSSPATGTYTLHWLEPDRGPDGGEELVTPRAEQGASEAPPSEPPPRAEQGASEVLSAEPSPPPEPDAAGAEPGASAAELGPPAVEPEASAAGSGPSAADPEASAADLDPSATKLDPFATESAASAPEPATPSAEDLPPMMQPSAPVPPPGTTFYGQEPASERDRVAFCRRRQEHPVLAGLDRIYGCNEEGHPSLWALSIAFGGFFGGEDLVDILYSDGSQETLRLGDGWAVIGGVRVTPLRFDRHHFTFGFEAGYKAKKVGLDGELAIQLRRNVLTPKLQYGIALPVGSIVFASGPSFDLGGQLVVRGPGESVSFGLNNSTGAVFDVGYWLDAGYFGVEALIRATLMKSEGEALARRASANSIGFVLGMTFGGPKPLPRDVRRRLKREGPPVAMRAGAAARARRSSGRDRGYKPHVSLPPRR